MSLNDKNMKVIDCIVLPNDGHECQVIENRAEQSSGNALIFEHTYHGDRDEHWVIEVNSKNEEVARYNVRHIQTIKWLSV